MSPLVMNDCIVYVATTSFLGIVLEHTKGFHSNVQSSYNKSCPDLIENECTVSHFSKKCA